MAGNCEDLFCHFCNIPARRSVCLGHLAQQILCIAGEKGAVSLHLIGQFEEKVPALIVTLEERLCEEIPLRQIDGIFARIAVGGSGLYTVVFIHEDRKSVV